MNQKAAFIETVQVAIDRGMPENPGSPTGLAHMRDMLTRIRADYSDAKVGRWLGWAQCALVAAEVGVTLDDVKAINMRWADQEDG